MREYVIIYLFNPLASGTSFSRTNWPMHITLLQSFSIPENELTSLVDDLDNLSSIKAMVSVAKEEATFGLNEDIPVVKVAKTQAIVNFHTQLRQIVDKYKPVYLSSQFMGDNFNPHTTIQTSGRIYIGDSILIDSFTLAQIRTTENEDLAEIIKRQLYPQAIVLLLKDNTI